MANRPISPRTFLRKIAGCWLGALCAMAIAAPPERPIAVTDLRSGLEFAGSDIRALQADIDANPAQLWIAQGRGLWSAQPPRRGGGGNAPSCRDCHGESSAQRGVALNFPRIHRPSGRLFNLEDQVRHCRAVHQDQEAPEFESDELLALSLAVTEASAGLRLRAILTPDLMPHFESGRALYERRQGQLNLACGHCHDRHWGRRFHTDPLSQGHPNGYPLFRLEWQKPGSLERRLRSCFFGVRADIPSWGDLTMRQLGLYLNWRGEGLPLEVPAVRK
jgi:sulfur-oxidizing protein SoxA